MAEENGEIFGYAYVSTYDNREAYNWAAELSVYVASESRGRGEAAPSMMIIEQQGIVHFLACIALLNDASISFHKKRSYQQVDHFPKIGYKFGQWHDNNVVAEEFG